MRHAIVALHQSIYAIASLCLLAYKYFMTLLGNFVRTREQGEKKHLLEEYERHEQHKK